MIDLFLTSALEGSECSVRILADFIPVKELDLDMNLISFPSLSSPYPIHDKH